MEVTGVTKNIEINGNILEVEELPAELPKAPEPVPKSPPTYSFYEDPEKPICFYYWINKWRAKEVVLDNNNEIYHLIGDFVYTSDGKFYMGIYLPNDPYEVDTMAFDPDECTNCCCPCFLRKEREYDRKREESEAVASIKYIDGKRVY